MERMFISLKINAIYEYFCFNYNRYCCKIHLDNVKYLGIANDCYLILNDYDFNIASACNLNIVVLIIIIMGIFKCYFSAEHIALSLKKNKNNDVNIELGKTNRLKGLHGAS